MSLDFRDTGAKYRHNEGDAAIADAKIFSQSIVPTANDMMICYSTVDGIHYLSTNGLKHLLINYLILRLRFVA